jgi:hypothetical protein
VKYCAGFRPKIDKCAVSDPQATPGSIGSIIPKKLPDAFMKYLQKFFV